MDKLSAQIGQPVTAVNVIVTATKKLTNNTSAVLDIAMFVMDNPQMHKSIIDNGDNFVDIVHDVRGLMQKDEFFVPRVLTTK